MPLCLEIVRADGRIQREHLRDERTTVGSSPQATVCIPDAPELEPLHILLLPREKGVWLSAARNIHTPVLLDGKPFESGQLALGAEVDIGSITFRVVAAQGSDRGNKLRTALLLVATVVVAIPLLKVNDPNEIPRSNAPPPALFPHQEVDCPVPGDAAEKRGRRAAERARSKTLRYPFDAREGLTAVELYRAAAPCLKDTELGDAIAGEETRLRQRIEDDYQILRLHLERSLGESDWRGAMEASRQLMALLADRPGEHTDYLASLQRFLDLQLNPKKDDPAAKDSPR